MIRREPRRLALAFVLLPCSLSSLQVGCASDPRAASTLERLQGTWEGFLAGGESSGKCTIAISGQSLHFRRDPTFWFETTFALVEGTNPQQLHATIRRSAPRESNIGDVMYVIFKVEDERLTLAGEQASAAEPPEEFPVGSVTGSAFRYDLRRVRRAERSLRCEST
jgi:hypothetical protein